MNAARADMRSLPLLRRCSQFCVIPYSSFLRVKLPTSVIATLCLTAPAYERTLLSQVPFASAGLCKVRAPLLLWIVYMLALGSTAIQKTRSQATHRSFVSMAFSPIRVGVIGPSIELLLRATFTRRVMLTYQSLDLPVRSWRQHEEIAHTEPAEDRGCAGCVGREQVPGVFQESCR